MTPAIQILKKSGIDFSIHRYKHNNAKSYGLEAVESLGCNGNEVFKTLIATGDCSNHIVAVIPVEDTLDLKKVASELKCKRVRLMDVKKAENITGYIQGAISPIAQKSQGKILLDNSALNHDKIYISGGRRGLEIGINPSDFAKFSNAKLSCIIKIA